MISAALLLWLTQAPDGDLLGQGAAAVAAFQAEEGVRLLEKARQTGPFTHAQLVLLYEQLGIAYAYLGRNDEAHLTFLRLMDIAPRHAISYFLSPRVTFIYERARTEAQVGVAPSLDLQWRATTLAEEPLELRIALSGRPVGVTQIGLGVRLRGEEQYTVLRRPLEEGVARVELPPLDPAGALTRQLFVVGLDALGNEVLELASRTSPREITLKPDLSPRWYQRWWVWVATGAVVAAVTSTVIYFVTRPPPQTVPATLQSSSF